MTYNPISSISNLFETLGDMIINTTTGVVSEITSLDGITELYTWGTVSQDNDLWNSSGIKTLTRDMPLGIKFRCKSIHKW